MNSKRSYLDTLNAGRQRRPQTTLEQITRSLENLEHEALPSEALPYLARARDGVARIGTIVRAMSEASRMERAIASADGEDMDLAQVVRGCAEAYRPLAGSRELRCAIPAQPVPMPPPAPIRTGV